MDWERNIRNTLLKNSPSIPSSNHASLAAVLIVVGYNRFVNQEQILLTKRTHGVETHKGQVSFPGGFFEKGDRSLLETALREYEEELGGNRKDLQILGGLSPLSTHLGVIIHPWVAKMVFPYDFQPNPEEVAAVIFLPLGTLLREGPKPLEIELDGVSIKSIGMEVEGELVWGATAKILDNLRRMITSEKN